MRMNLNMVSSLLLVCRFSVTEPLPSLFFPFAPLPPSVSPTPFPFFPTAFQPFHGPLHASF